MSRWLFATHPLSSCIIHASRARSPPSSPGKKKKVHWKKKDGLGPSYAGREGRVQDDVGKTCPRRSNDGELAEQLAFHVHYSILCLWPILNFVNWGGV